MPRHSRIEYPGAIYHAMTRGNRRTRIYEDDTDRRLFLALIVEVVRRYAVKVFAFCLMENHYHLVVETPRGNLAAAMRQLNGVFAQASNRRHGRSGHLFGGRYRSPVVQFERYLKRVVRYVVLNPVRARMTGEAAGWAWSSYRAMAGLEAAPEWLCLDWLTAAFEAPSLEEAQRRYALYVNAPVTRKARINTSAPAIGSKAFVTQLIDAGSPRPPDRPLPPVFVPVVRPPLAELLAASIGWSPERDLAIAEAHARHGYSLSEIARQLALDPSTISKAMRRTRQQDFAKQAGPLKGAATLTPPNGKFAWPA